MNQFELVSNYQPTGDQPQAIRQPPEGVLQGVTDQTLLGVTGSGKTFTIANVIAQVNKPTLVLSHNKTLAAQLYGEFKQFFPHNAVEYYVSYYDYYQPEAYLAATDTYIEKDFAINEEIDRLPPLRCSRGARTCWSCRRCRVSTVWAIRLHSTKMSSNSGWGSSLTAASCWANSWPAFMRATMWPLRWAISA